MFFSKPKSYLGVNLGAAGIKVVELRLEKKRPVLYTYGFTGESQSFSAVDGPFTDEFLTPERADKYAAILKNTCRACKTTATQAAVSLPSSEIFHAVVTMPEVKKEEFNTILQAEIKKLLPRPIAELSLDYQVLPGPADAKSSRVLVNAVSRKLVSFYTNIFQKAGLKLDALEPESSALTRALVGRDPSVAMIVDMGAQRTNFFIVEKSVPVTHHSLEVGGEKSNAIMMERLGVSEKMSEQIKYDISVYLEQHPNPNFSSEQFLNMFSPLVDPIINEISYGFDTYLHQIGNEKKRPEKVILTGGASFLPFLPQLIAQKFQIKCYIGDPWSRVVYQDGLKPVLGLIGPRMAVAIGLALRGVV